MKVYVVFHADIEDDRYVRAVCSTRELAERVANSPKPCSDSHATYVDPAHRRHLRYGPGSYARELEPTDRWNCYGAHDHFTDGGAHESLCCGVEEWDLDTAEVVQVLDHAATA